MATPRILVVEDETIIALDIAATLLRLGYDVVGMVGTGAAAIEAAREHEPDLILMDIRLKGPMDGIAAATAIQDRRPTPIIFLTAHGDVDTVERSKKASPHAYLLKPFDERALHRVVEIALHRAVIDKSARDQSVDALWKSEERFRLLVEAVKDYAMFVIDRAGWIASWNPGAEAMTGYSEQEVIGQPFSLLFATSDDARNAEQMLAEVRERGVAEWDGVGVRKDGSRYVPHVHCTTLSDRDGEPIGYVTIARDVTAQRKAEAQLIQMQRLESLGQLAGGIAHDFNNMLMVIFARCDILLHTLTTDRERRFVSDIRSAALKNRDLTQQLLAAARQQVLEPHVVDLNDVVRSAMQLLAPTLGENILIQQELHHPLWNVHADPGKLHQVLLNLAVNARDAMPDGGTLTIETRNIHVDTWYARQHVGLAEGDYAVLVVTDTGTGIPPEIRDRIYDPFFTTKDPGRGTGLGLAVVRGIVEQTGGLTWVYSEEGRGTTFKIFLPRHASSGVERDQPAEEALPERGTETILLVEDEALLRSVMREALEEHGYFVLEARTPVEAVTISDQFPDRIDLLLTDVIMPVMTGRELAEQLARARPDMNIIFMSGYATQTILNRNALGEGVRYLEKPIPTSLLLRTVRTALE